MAWQHRTVAQEMMVVSLTRSHCQREIAELTGLTKGVVLSIQRKYHLVLSFGRSTSSARFRYAYDEHIWGRLIELLYIDMRLPLDEVARRCDVSIDTVRRRMDHLGIPRRAVGESNRGTKRGPYQAWLIKLPRCQAGCGRGVKTDHPCCAVCRRRMRRAKLKR